jgi:hypothetical protein
MNQNKGEDNETEPTSIQLSFKRSYASLNLDSLFSSDSQESKEELVKLKILLHQDIIKRKEFRVLKKQNASHPANSIENKANQLYALNQLLNSDFLSQESFQLKKEQIILR